MSDHFVDIPGPDVLKFKVVLDVAKAWNLMELTPGAAQLLTFRGTRGYVRFARCCFGPMNAPAAWERFTVDLADDLNFIRKQVDDIFVFGPEFGVCVDNLLTLVARCNERNIPLKQDKVQFFSPSVRFAGRTISACGTMSPLRDHLDRILNFEDPGMEPSLIRSLLGLSQWLSMYVPDMAAFLEPFAALIRSKTLADYDPVKQKDSLKALQNACRKYVGIRVLDNSKPVALFCDACDTAVSSVLLQPLNPEKFGDGDFSDGFNVVHIDSHLLNATQRRWAIIEKEMWAIISALNTLKDRIFLLDVVIFSDHRPLRYLFRNSLSGGGGPARIQRWLVSLSGWRLTLHYYPGKQNVLADAISRADFTFDEENGYVVHIPPFSAKSSTMSFSVAVLDQAVDLPLSLAEAMLNDCFACYFFSRRDATPFDAKKFDSVDVQNAERDYTLYDSNLVGGKDSIFFRAEEMMFRLRYIPFSLRKTYFNAYHSSLFAGHPGSKKTFEALSRFFWFPNMKEFVEEECKKCHRCQVGKANGVTLDFTRKFETIPVTYPFAALICDAAGPFPTTERGNRYVLFAIDYSTRFTSATASPSDSAKDFASFLMDKVVLVFGTPQVVKSDRGSEFDNQLMRVLCERLGTNQEFTAPYSPQGVAVNERSHVDFGNFVRTTGAEDWDLLVPYFVFVRNNRKNESIGQSPFYAMFGRQAVNPMDAAAVAFMTRTFGAEGVESLSLSEWVKHLESDAKFREARLETARLYEQKRFDSQRGKGERQREVQIGDLVAIRTSPKKLVISNPKLALKWLAPFKVEKILGHNLTMSYLPDPSIVVERHAQDVKLYFSDDASVQTDDLESPNYVIEKVIDARGDSENREYLIKWENFPDEFNLWVSRDSINDSKLCDDMDLKFPPQDLMPSVQLRNRAKEWVQNLRPSDVSSVVGIRNTRSGKELELFLKGAKVSCRAPIKQLPAAILELAEVRSLLDSAVP